MKISPWFLELFSSFQVRLELLNLEGLNQKIPLSFTNLELKVHTEFTLTGKFGNEYNSNLFAPFLTC